MVLVTAIASYVAMYVATVWQLAIHSLGCNMGLISGRLPGLIEPNGRATVSSG